MAVGLHPERLSGQLFRLKLWQGQGQAKQAQGTARWGTALVTNRHALKFPGESPGRTDESRCRFPAAIARERGHVTAAGSRVLRLPPKAPQKFALAALRRCLGTSCHWRAIRCECRILLPSGDVPPTTPARPHAISNVTVTKAGRTTDSEDDGRNPSRLADSSSRLRQCLDLRRHGPTYIARGADAIR